MAKCDICGRDEIYRSSGPKIKRLAQDHCHKTGVIRGYLCHSCNVGLGLFRDDINSLKNAIKYLEADWEKINQERAKAVFMLLDIPYKGRGQVTDGT